ncbi:hypothetical protein LPJ73_007041, partial [Coemansia sp. RSA 2703]
KQHGDARQMALIACVRWISRYERLAASRSQALWASQVFLALAPEILQIDDAAFLSALMRHLLAARQASLLGTPAVQRLLVHVQLASRGSPRFASHAPRLVRLCSGHETLTAFVFALIGANALSLSAEHAGALAVYAQLGGSRVAQYCLALVARRTTSVAAHVWAPLVSQITQMVDGALAREHETLPYALAMARLVQPVMPVDARVSLARRLCAAAAGVLDAKLVADLASTCFAVLLDVPCVPLDLDESVRGLRVRVVELWAQRSGQERLTQAALQATGGVHGVQGGLRAGISAARERLARPGEFASVDVARVLGRVHRRAKLRGLECTAQARGILARLFGICGALRLQACGWAEARAKKGSVCVVAWLVHALAQHYIISPDAEWWRVSALAQRVHSVCVAVGARINNGAEQLAGDEVFVAGVFVQAASDRGSKAAAAALYAALVHGAQPIEHRAQIVCAMALCKSVDVSARLAVLADVVEMAQHGALDSEPAANAHVMGVLVRAASH